MSEIDYLRSRRHLFSYRFARAAPVLVALAAVVLCICYVTPARFGFYFDDGIYVVTAKALAEDRGYRIISLPEEPYQTKYPPVYPLLLSLVWRLYPRYPANIAPMMVLSALATGLFLLASYWYLVGRGYASRRQALLVLVFTAMNWTVLFFASNLLSEMPYGALSVAALLLLEKYAD